MMQRMETHRRFNPETGKPLPVTPREYMLKDRHETKAFLAPLSRKERLDLQKAVSAAVIKMPLAERRSIADALVTKLENRRNTSIADILELTWARTHQAQLHLPEKKPIFFRKLRTREIKLPTWLGEAKSPYLIATR